MKLEIKGLCQDFGGPAVLRQVSLCTGNIQSLVLVGPSGGGKSTLLRILAGLDIPKAGSVSFDKTFLPQNEIGLFFYRKQVGTVFQGFNLFPHLSAFDNLLLPLIHVHGLSQEQARERVREPLNRFQLSDHAHKRPAELSGGQKQRIAILRALVTKPQMLFLDEPTSALDPEMTAEVLRMIQDLKSIGTRFVLVTHEMNFARHVADEIACIADGEVVAHGSGKEMFSNCPSPRMRSFFESILA